MKENSKETRGEYVLRMLKEQRAKQPSTIEQIHAEVINLAQFVYQYRTSDLAFKGEMYNTLRKLNTDLLSYREANANIHE
jgi:hypothetical protein